MENNDTIHLLKECDAGTKMGVTSIDDVMEYVENKDLKALLAKSKEHHETLGNELHSLLLTYGSEEKEPATMAKGMSWLKTNMKLTMNNSDSTVADLLIDGCNMGVKSLYKYLNQYPAANLKVKNLCQKLIDIEEQLCRDLRVYL